MKNLVAKYSIEDQERWRLNDRIKVLEEKAFKKLKRLRATEAQRFLIFFHLGLLNPIKENAGLLQHQKDTLISVILDIDPDNAKKFLLETGKKIKPLLRTKSNYTFLVNFFETLGCKQTANEVHKILLKINNYAQKG